MKYRTQGFTLLELIISVTVLSVLLVWAIPSFQSLTLGNRVTIETNRLVTHLQLARSEALKRGARTILCRSDDPLAASPSCSSTSGTWSSGWLVFVSGDNNDVYDAANDTLIKIGVPVNGKINLKANSTAATNLIYAPDASTDEGGQIAEFSICDGRGPDHGRLVEVPAVGAPRLVSPASSCPG